MQRLTGVLFAPVETFRDIAARPDILLPLAVILIVSIASAIVIVPRVDFESAMREEMLKANPNVAEEDLERVMRFTVAFARAMAYAAPVLSLVMLAVIAGVLLLAFRLMGGEGTFKEAFSVTVYSWMPLVIQGLIGIIVLLARGSASAQELQNLVMSNLGFLADMTEQPVAFTLLSSLDLFTIWTLVLFTIGFSFVSRMSRGKSAAIVVSLWALQVLIRVGFAALGAARAAA